MAAPNKRRITVHKSTVNEIIGGIIGGAALGLLGLALFMTAIGAW